MRTIFYNVLIQLFLSFILISCNSDRIAEEWEKNGCPGAYFSGSSSITFGQTYQQQVNSCTGDSSIFTYALNNQPEGMTISSSGLIEWTPNKGSQITTHPNINVTVTDSNGNNIDHTFTLTITGTCTTGNIMSIWTGDHRILVDRSKLLGNVIAYTDNSSSVKTASQNYNYYSSSVHLTHGPTPTATTGNVFFYHQYNNDNNTYFFWMFGVKGNSVANNVKLDVFTDNNSSTDAVVVSDDSGETAKQSSGCGSSSACYTGRYAYNSKNSDGGVIGPFSGEDYKIFVDLGGTSIVDGSSSLTVGSLDSFKYYSKDGLSFPLGNVDNFTVGYNTSIDCEN